MKSTGVQRFELFYCAHNNQISESNCSQITESAQLRLHYPLPLLASQAASN